MQPSNNLRASWTVSKGASDDESGTVAVLGAGSWGTALAVHLARVGHDVRLWARDPVLAAEISSKRYNAIYLPDIVLPENVVVSAVASEVLREVSLIVSAIPSHGCRGVMRAAAPLHLACERRSSARPKGSRSTPCSGCRK